MRTLFDCPNEECDFASESEHGVKVHISQAHSFDKTVSCEYCGETKEFPDKNPSELEDRKYCSRECTQNAIAERRKDRVIIECKECGNDFEVIPSREDRAKYCSENCRLENFTEIGKEAGKDTRFEEGNEPWNKGLSIEESEKIQEIALKTQKAQKGIKHNPGIGFQSGEDHHNWKEDYEYDKFRGDSWKTQRLKALNRDDYVCQLCETKRSNLDLPLDVHHKTPFREFENSETANQLDDLVCLCRSCHMKVETGSETLK